jgi:Concanavalin A-like lectin/glucanases superfamily
MNRVRPCLLGLTFALACASPREGLETGGGGQTGTGNGSQGGGPQTGGTSAGGSAVGGTAAGGSVTGGTAGVSTDSGVPDVVDDTALREFQRRRREEILRTLPKPIGEWLFDDAAGSIVKDSSGNRNTGTVMKGQRYPAMVHPSPVWQMGLRGTALQLSGLDEWVMVDSSDSIDSFGINGTISISAWVFVRRHPSPEHIVALFQRHHAATRLEQYFLGISPAGTLRVGRDFFYSDAKTALPIGRWTHVAMTYDGIEQCGYVDGSAVTCHDVGTIPESDSTPVTMGAGINEADVIENLDGAIDEVRFYNVGFNGEQIAALAYRL